MLMYTALIPYGLAANEVVCALRSTYTRLVYAAAFALMCTRCPFHEIILDKFNFGIHGHNHKSVH
jgi:hypothetical protein